jgi:hypothetical protein
LFHFFLFDPSVLLCLLARLFFSQQSLAHPGNYLDHPPRLLETSVYGFLQGTLMTKHPADLKPTLQHCQRLAKIMQLRVHLLYNGIAYL